MPCFPKCFLISIEWRRCSMSRGIGAFAHLILQDEENVLYAYGSYNWNDKMYYNDNRICDGIITINRSCFVDPDIHEKLKKLPSGRKKLVTKRIPNSVNYEQMIIDGSIQIENSTNCWKTSDYGIDVMALHLLYRLFLQYQEEGLIPECVNYNV